ncbi:2-amino-4-hydroxy-6-hydroxymethyldihydropteridine diphosphokinase [Marivirga tractuosa]|uniref:2-amino-4-hydroxy-6-hydroxymethyldihydropteridine pyrophosphokinase n=1 Tax=Marivirga tractuosa (strain ATCC 23168 / DSM 4126 / NBRC 15989 / NCIMB 1408 / VKM B-1430 / H-43) TaxID=643867 RepID=E4TUX6_MARTH|nr:2-amino-4-hydroxy-6-hydroxymethyldihydropteridine diphosphokinase [Marivirga tractuosa]ADR21081.1 2-amino-4-hydroxy-6-hydroxymethyldihydropteridine pyrophosphokinase [Marivirga tractuosa DSM 4126]BDD14464.1 2-amino-4-hydroxy-6-hydroxymethyldihydropteridine diphosphokinase [Marivirga tractuosa]
MEGIFLLLGSNLGNRLNSLIQANEALEEKGIKVLNKSSVYETAAWGKTDQQAFLNQVVKVDTSLEPAALLNVILEIELELGRVRKIKWGERLIDIDILYFHNYLCEADDLSIPHPGIPDRRFTLIPLVELCPDFLHPKLKVSQKELLANCEDNLDVSLFEKY